jgi:hypothetical protein
MAEPLSKQCWAIIETLKTLSDPNRHKNQSYYMQVIDDLVRFSLWMGESGALHKRSLLQERDRIQVLDTLNDLNKTSRKRT